MLVPITDPTHLLSAMMLELIRESRNREFVQSLHGPDADPVNPTTPRRRAWSRLATVHKTTNGKRIVRIFRAPAPAI